MSMRLVDFAAQIGVWVDWRDRFGPIPGAYDEGEVGSPDDIRFIRSTFKRVRTEAPDASFESEIDAIVGVIDMALASSVPIYVCLFGG